MPDFNDSLYCTVVGLREISVIVVYILDYKFDCVRGHCKHGRDKSFLLQ